MQRETKLGAGARKPMTYLNSKWVKKGPGKFLCSRRFHLNKRNDGNKNRHPDAF